MQFQIFIYIHPFKSKKVETEILLCQKITRLEWNSNLIPAYSYESYEPTYQIWGDVWNYCRDIEQKDNDVGMKKDKETIKEWDNTICYWPFYGRAVCISSALVMGQYMGKKWKLITGIFPLAGLTTCRKDHWSIVTIQAVSQSLRADLWILYQHIHIKCGMIGYM